MTTKDYKNMINSFNSADFGDYDPKEFIEGNLYRKPKIYPGCDHPRILFTKNSIDKVRENIKSEQSAAAYKKYIELSDTEWDGKFMPVMEDWSYKSNFADKKVGIIEAKAFRYAMTGDKKYGYEAIVGAKNMILTIDARHSVSDWCRDYGFVMYICSCVYDWCYDLLTEEDKKQFIAGCLNRLATELEVCCFVEKGNKLPIGQGPTYNHGAEDQILVDYLSFAIAVFNEAPEIYELVGGRLLNDYVEANNLLLQSGSHWEGACYGFCRTTSLIVSTLLFNKMTDGYFNPFTPALEDVIVTTSYYLRPDGQVYRIGDFNQNRRIEDGPQIFWLSFNCFYAGNLYKNTYLKALSYKLLNGFTSFRNSVAGLTAVQFLCINDPEVPHIYDEKVPLTQRSYYPLTNVFAKSAHDDKDAFGLYMTMPETCTLAHAHAECGSFQIFYKGSLASDAGAADNWGGAHDFGYYRQTIAANSILVYNPALKDTYAAENRKFMVYSGGQSFKKSHFLNSTYEGMLRHPGFGQCTSLGVKNLEKDGKYLYSYMAGDMTNAYDDETVDEVSRYMFAFATGDKKCPYAFMTFDRITAKDASFHKSALIHVLEEPKIDKDFAIITDTRFDYSGKMVVQTVGDEAEYTVVGGEGKEWWIPGVDENGNYSIEAGRNLPHAHKLVENSMAEYGYGRIEISPKNHEKTNRMLSVMYVTDAENTDKPIKAKDISDENLAGAEIFGKSVLFPKNDKLIRGEISIKAEEDGEYFVCGVMSGKWTLSKNGEEIETLTVRVGENMLHLSASIGEYTFTPVHLDSFGW